jgi:hypothetical protein
MLKDHQRALEDLDMANVFKQNNALTLKTHKDALFGSKRIILSRFSKVRS